ncbi:MAG: IgA Peptidase M64 [Gemmatimonadota bacterium]|nr:IgA Peptidase M64 [Gemmatimonadota bacterium]
MHYFVTLTRLATCAALIAAVAAPVHAQHAPRFDRFFVDKTMRVDYFHTGNASTEIVSLDRIVSDGPWAGSTTTLLDDTNLGKYVYEVIDTLTGSIMYSRGFASIYGEWETTPEARERSRTFHESLRFPWPKAPVRVVLKKRDDQNAFVEFASLDIDPSDRSVNPADLPPRGRVWTVFEHGPPQQKVDLVLLGEGYTEEELPTFHNDVRRLTEALFAYEPFKSRRQDFNVRAIDLPAAESGVSRPHAGKYRRNPVATQYSIFDSERYVLTYDNRTLRDVISAAPYEYVAILVNEKQYGGGGIYNFHATAAVGSAFADYLFVHEFGHHFAGLADEYYTSPVAYETGAMEHIEPWEPNVTSLHSAAALKWRDLVSADTPLPTPWAKEQFEAHSRAVLERRVALIETQAPEAEFDALFREQQAIERDMLNSMEYSGHVGAFEGASYESRGLYRPEIDCIMFSRNMMRFCEVCQRAIARIIDLYT